MKGLKKLIILLLSALTLCVGTIGLTSCFEILVDTGSGVSITSNNQNDSVEKPNSTSSNRPNSDKDDAHSSENRFSSDDYSEQYSEDVTASDSDEDISDSEEVSSSTHKHSWNNGFVVEEATCTENGLQVFTCVICRETLDIELPLLGHSFVQVPARAATCTENGYNAYFECENCYDKINYVEILATGHTYYNKACVRCADPEPNHEHVWNDGIVVLEPTCLNVGEKWYACFNCQDIREEDIPALGHSLIEYSSKDATCVEDGHSAYVACGRCSYTFGYTEIPAMGHNYYNLTCTECGADEPNHIHVWGEGVVTKYALCDEEGEMSYRCLNCVATKTEPIPMIAHELVYRNQKLPTCTQIGWYGYETCRNCDYTSYTEIPAKGHSMRTYARVESTCTVSGHEAYQACDNCTYTTGYVSLPLKDHTYYNLACTVCGAAEADHEHEWDLARGTLTQTATCTRVSITAYPCKNCTEKMYFSGTMLPHTLVSHAQKDPTCTESGWAAYETCANCSYSTYTVEPALGHNLRTIGALEATCEVNGHSAYQQCQRCTYHTEYDVYTAMGHDYYNLICGTCGAREENHVHVWDSGYESVSPTCISTGTRIYNCNSCVATKSEIIPMVAHTIRSYPKKDPTCTTYGWFAYVECLYCFESTYTEIPALGHMYDNGVITTQPGCETNGTLLYTCYRCADTHTQSIAAHGHRYGNWAVTKPATCTESGIKVCVCTYDSTHTVSEDIAPIGHTWGEWTETRAATCAKEGVEQRICAHDASHVETRSIRKTDDHNMANDGKCTVCGKVIKNPLATPAISSKTDVSVVWNNVSNVEYYVVKILPNDVYVDVNNPVMDLEEYFAGNKYLYVSIQAIADPGSDYVNSAWSNVYTFEIVGETVVGTRGVGDAVNLLTGGYTDFASGTTRIFDDTLFSRLRLMEDTNVRKQQTVVTYKEGLDAYLTQKMRSVNGKTSTSASVGVDKVAKVTMGYNFEVGAEYQTTTYNETKAIFYDMDYYYISSQKEIYGYNDTDKLSAILSAGFKADAAKVANGTMSASNFIKKYGTHIVTAGIYGAKFNAHYEVLTSKANASTLFGANIQNSINAAVKGSVYGVDIGVDTSNSVSVSSSRFATATSAALQSKFVATAIGGSAQGITGATSLDSFSSACATWAAGISDSNCVLIDVPDESLVLVWDFLGDEYAAAKDILNEYFFTQCDNSYYALKDKISNLYSESVTFDADRGILTINFAGLQSYESASLADVSYTKRENGVDFSDGLMTIYPMVDGVPVEKVVFKGSYYQNNTSGQLKTNRFNDFAVKFDSSWINDITVELNSFAFEARVGRVALDFSATSSRNITLSVINRAYVKGGNGTGVGANGFAAIVATGKNVTQIGDGRLEICGGHGIDGSAGATGENGTNGGNGGDALIAEVFTLTDKAVCQATGGNGGAGGKGGDGTVGNSAGYREVSGWTNHDDAVNQARGGKAGATGGKGGDGGRGGDGGASGYALDVEILSVGSGAQVIAYTGVSGDGGAGGNGGNGGAGQNIKQTSIFGNAQPGQGGNGGNGGDGGDAGTLNSAIPTHNTTGNITIYTAEKSAFGQGGKGGSGGAPGVKSGKYSDWYADWGSSGKDGFTNAYVYAI